MDFFKESETRSWLIIKLIVFFTLLTSGIFLNIIDKRNSKAEIIFYTIWMTFMTCYFGYKQIEKYNRNVCLAKFGPEFNNRRQGLGIPVIPPNWHVEISGNLYARWQAKDSIIGHESKRIEVGPNCTVESEYDEYDLRSVQKKSRSLSIYTEYTKGKSKDSISYSFTFGDSTRNLTRQQADSIFAAEKIKKDY